MMRLKSPYRAVMQSTRSGQEHGRELRSRKLLKLDLGRQHALVKLGVARAARARVGVKQPIQSQVVWPAPVQVKTTSPVVPLKRLDTGSRALPRKLCQIEINGSVKLPAQYAASIDGYETEEDDFIDMLFPPCTGMEIVTHGFIAEALARERDISPIEFD